MYTYFRSYTLVQDSIKSEHTWTRLKSNIPLFLFNSSILIIYNLETTIEASRVIPYRWLINVPRRRKRNPLDVLILSPLARINRSFEHNLGRGKYRSALPPIFFSQVETRWKFHRDVNTGYFIMSTLKCISIKRSKPIRRACDVFALFYIFHIYLIVNLY